MAADHVVVDLGVDPFSLGADRLREWGELTGAAHDCTRCDLHEGRTRVVFGDGDPDADLMIIGDAPTRQEDLQEKPFLGAGGNMLNSALGDAGLERSAVYLTTIVKCRPPQQRQPLIEEVERCSPYLLEQLAHVRPKVVVTMGEWVTQLLLRRRVPIRRVAGFRFDMYGATLIPTFHPSAALRGDPRAVATIRRDIHTAKAVLDGRLASGAEAVSEYLARQS